METQRSPASHRGRTDLNTEHFHTLKDEHDSHHQTACSTLTGWLLFWQHNISTSRCEHKRLMDDSLIIPESTRSFSLTIYLLLTHV